MVVDKRMPTMIEIPANIVTNGNMLTKPTDISVYVALSLHSTGAACRAPSVESIAQYARCSVDEAMESLKALEYAGIIGIYEDNFALFDTYSTDILSSFVPKERAASETPKLPKYMRDEFGDACALTGVSLDVTIDHVLPRGADWSKVNKRENLLPMDRRLNSSKGSKNIFKWFNEVKGRFNLDEKKFSSAVSYLARKNGMTDSQYYVFYNLAYNDYLAGEKID